MTRPRPAQVVTLQAHVLARVSALVAALASTASVLAMALTGAALVGCSSEPTAAPDATSLASAALQVAAPGAEHRAEWALA